MGAPESYFPLKIAFTRFTHAAMFKDSSFSLMLVPIV